MFHHVLEHFFEFISLCLHTINAHRCLTFFVPHSLDPILHLKQRKSDVLSLSLGFVAKSNTIHVQLFQFAPFAKYATAASE